MMRTVVGSGVLWLQASCVVLKELSKFLHCPSYGQSRSFDFKPGLAD